MDIFLDIFRGVIVTPMINSLVLLYFVFFANFGLAIIVFTVIVRMAMIPLTVKQSRQMKAMSSLQPQIKEIQNKYKGDRQKITQETTKIWKEQGVNPLGCLGPLVVQMPIFFGLFWALRGTLPSTPERLADLSKSLYPWLPLVHETVPLEGDFLWLDLARYSSQNPVPLLLPVLVGASMFVMQKMTITPSASPQQASTNRMMLWLMPIMFGFFTLNFETGLALYWIVSNVVGIVIQGYITGWDPLVDLLKIGRKAPSPESASGGPEPAPALTPPAEEADTSENDRDHRKNPRGGHRNRPKGARRRASGRRNRRS